MDANMAICTSVGVYEHALTRGRHYQIVDQAEDKYRIIGDHGKRVWISKEYFNQGRVPLLIMKSWQFDDDTETNEFVEVTITFNDGSERWCNLTTPEKLVKHFKNPMMDPPGINSKHLIIMKTLEFEDVEKTLKYLDSHGDLEDGTLPLS